MSATILTEIAGRPRAPGHEPWPRHVVDEQTWSAVARALGEGGGDLLSLWADGEQVHLALRTAALEQPMVVSVAVRAGGYPSVGRYHLPALRLERALRDLYGIEPAGLPDPRPWLDHGAWSLSAPLGARVPAAVRDPADYVFLPVHGEGLHQIPVGPVHAGIIEPGHFRFTANGETVARLEERLGYVHKGVDGLLAGADLETAGRIVARISGDSTVAYGFAFARAVEAALGVEVPRRAEMLRGIMAELERIANHLGDIGAICNDAAFALNHAHCGILREKVLAASEQAFGHRLMMDRVVPGGVAEFPSMQNARTIEQTLDEIMPWFADVVRVYDGTPSLQDRTCGTGVVGPELVARWGAGGFVGRGSGRGFDARRDLMCRYSRRATSTRASGCASARSRRACRSCAPGSRRSARDRCAATCRRPLAFARASRSSRRSAATCWCGCVSPTAAWRAATRATRRGSSGRCSRRRSKTTSSPISRSVTNPSIAPTRATTCEGVRMITKRRAESWHEKREAAAGGGLIPSRPLARSTSPFQGEVKRVCGLNSQSLHAERV